MYFPFFLRLAASLWVPLSGGWSLGPELSWLPAGFAAGTWKFRPEVSAGVFSAAPDLSAGRASGGLGMTSGLRARAEWGGFGEDRWLWVGAGLQSFWGSGGVSPTASLGGEQPLRIWGLEKQFNWGLEFDAVFSSIGILPGAKLVVEWRFGESDSNSREPEARPVSPDFALNSFGHAARGRR